MQMPVAQVVIIMYANLFWAGFIGYNNNIFCICTKCNFQCVSCSTAIFDGDCLFNLDRNVMAVVFI